jgi:hypothetical protein
VLARILQARILQARILQTDHREIHTPRHVDDRLSILVRAKSGLYVLLNLIQNFKECLWLHSIILIRPCCRSPQVPLAENLHQIEVCIGSNSVYLAGSDSCHLRTMTADSSYMSCVYKSIRTVYLLLLKEAIRKGVFIANEHRVDSTFCCS